jgi:hypothetical protein
VIPAPVGGPVGPLRALTSSMKSAAGRYPAEIGAALEPLKRVPL